MHAISSLFIYTEQAEETAEYDHESGNTYISLPRLFNLPSVNVRHGIILKSGDAENDNEHNHAAENKFILLTTEVECETEIPGEEIYPIPKALGGIRFSALFSGIKFDAESPVLVLDPERLVQSYGRELII